VSRYRYLCRQLNCEPAEIGLKIGGTGFFSLVVRLGDPNQ
jgi:hypothetical protein